MRNRVHGFLADHLRTVQYPRETSLTAERGFRWKHAMSPTTRAGLALVSLFWIIVLGGFAIALAVIGWAFIGAAIGAH